VDGRPRDGATCGPYASTSPGRSAAGSRRPGRRPAIHGRGCLTGGGKTKWVGGVTRRRLRERGRAPADHRDSPTGIVSVVERTFAPVAATILTCGSPRGFPAVHAPGTVAGRDHVPVPPPGARKGKLSSPRAGGERPDRLAASTAHVLSSAHVDRAAPVRDSRTTPVRFPRLAVTDQRRLGLPRPAGTAVTLSPQPGRQVP